MQGRILEALYAASNAQQLPGSAGLSPRDIREPRSDRLPEARRVPTGASYPKRKG